MYDLQAKEQRDGFNHLKQKRSKEEKENQYYIVLLKY